MSERGLPRHVLTEIGSPIREARLSGVDELLRLVLGTDSVVAAAARQALIRLTGDDSRSVAAAAAAAIERTSVRLRPERIDFGRVPLDGPRLVADVLVEGPPLAVASASLTVSGPGLRAMLNGRRLRIIWIPRSDWLDGLVTVRGPAGWAEVRVTGQVAAAGPNSWAVRASQAEGEERAGLGSQTERGKRAGLGSQTEGEEQAVPGPQAKGDKWAGPTSRGEAAKRAEVENWQRPPDGPDDGVGGLVDPEVIRATVLPAAPVAEKRSWGRSGAPPAAETRSWGRSGAAPMAEKWRRGRAGGGPGRWNRRRAGSIAVLAALTVLVLLGGVGVAMALTGRKPVVPVVAAPTPALPAGSAPPNGSTANGSAANGPTANGSPANGSPANGPTANGPAANGSAAGTVTTVPLASRIESVGNPAVITEIAVGAEPEGVAVSPDSRTVYVADQSSHVLSVVDAASHRVTSVQLRNTPRFVTVSRDGRLVFVSMYEDDKSGSGVAVVDAASRTVLRYLSTGVQPYALAIGPDGRLWVPIHSEHRVELYTAGGQRPDGRIETPPNPHAVAFSADLMRAFTPDHESNAVSIIDMRTDTLLASIPVSRAPHSLAVAPDGRTVLVAGYEADAADLIDAITLRKTGPFRVGRQPQSVAFAADGGHGYVVNEGDGTVSVLDGHSGAVTATVQVGHSPRAIAVSPDGRLAYVSNGRDDTLSVLRVGV